MQKKLIALAVAAAFAPAMAMAEVTVYGQAHISVDGNSSYKNVAGQDSSGTTVASNSSRLGVKGSKDLGDGLSAVFKYESGVDLTGQGNATSDGNGGGATGSLFTNSRDAWVGLAGGFGTVIAGRLPLANQYVYDVNYFADQMGDAGDMLSIGNVGGRVNNTIGYISPNFGGFSFLGAFVPRTGNSTTTTSDSSYTLRGDFAMDAFKAGVSYQDVSISSAAPSIKIASVFGSFDFGMGNVSAQYVNSNNGGQVSTADQDAYTIGASFKTMEKGVLKAQYTVVNDVNNTNNTGASMAAVGFDYSLDKSTTIYAAYAAVSNNSGAGFRPNGYGHGNEGLVVGAGEDPSGVSVGMVYSF